MCMPPPLFLSHYLSLLYSTHCCVLNENECLDSRSIIRILQSTTTNSSLKVNSRRKRRERDLLYWCASKRERERKFFYLQLLQIYFPRRIRRKDKTQGGRSNSSSSSNRRRKTLIQWNLGREMLKYTHVVCSWSSSWCLSRSLANLLV
jgi:hypothetical protein